MRRNRRHEWSRRLVSENQLSVNDLIWPVFVIDGDNKTEDVTSMPNVQRLSIDLLVDAVGNAKDLGIPAVALFPFTDPALKNAQGSESINPENLVCRAVRAIKAAHGDDIGVMCDVALDPYTDHGHDGLLEDGYVVNDASVKILAQQALIQAEAGCDVIAPSDMMDGRVDAIRWALDEAGFEDVLICSYCAKYASAFYGPFRDALDSAPKEGDKKTYQMDPANAREAIREIQSDEEEGADWLLIKPGLPYLDIIRLTREHSALPVAAYHVSGEYAMLKAADEKGWLDYDSCLIESLISLRRAGADMIFTYGAIDAASILTGRAP